MNRQGQMAVIWPEGPSTYNRKYVTVRFWVDGQWSDIYQINEGREMSSAYCCNVAACPDGSFYFAWIDGISIYYRKYDPQTQWSDLEKLDGVWSQYGLCMTCTALNTTIIAYVYYNPDFNVFIKENKDGIWSNSILIDSVKTGNDDLEIASGPYGDAHLIFLHDTGCHIEYIHILPDLTFDSYCYDKQPGAELWPSIFIDRLNIIHLLYRDRNEEKYTRVFYGRLAYPGAPLEDLRQVSDNLSGQLFEHYSNIVVDDFLVPTAAWTVYWDDTNANTNNFSRSLSYEYPENSEIVDEYPSVTPKMVTENNGIIHIIYLHRDSADCGYQVYHQLQNESRPGARVVMEPQIYYPSDHLKVSVALANPTTSEFSADLYVCLEVNGQYYWYPDWMKTITNTSVDLPSGQDSTLDVLDLTMPPVLPNVGPYHIFSGMLNPATQELIGSYSGAGMVLRSERT